MLHASTNTLVADMHRVLCSLCNQAGAATLLLAPAPVHVSTVHYSINADPLSANKHDLLVLMHLSTAFAALLKIIRVCELHSIGGSIGGTSTVVDCNVMHAAGLHWTDIRSWSLNNVIMQCVSLDQPWVFQWNKLPYRNLGSMM